MRRLAELLKLRGAAEIDLVFSEGRWYIIEANLRYTFLSLVIAAMRGKSVFAPYVETATGNMPVFDQTTLNKVIDFNTGWLSYDRMKSLQKRYDFIAYISRFRLTISEMDEESYCEFVVTGKTKEELISHIDFLRENEDHLVENKTYQRIRQILS